MNMWREIRLLFAKLLHPLREFQRGPAYMPIPRCDQCGWWKPFEADAQPATVGGIVERLSMEGFGGVLKSLILPMLGDCTLFECHNKEQVHEDSMVIVTRTKSGEATIVTCGSFGCVQRKERR